MRRCTRPTPWTHTPQSALMVRRSRATRLIRQYPHLDVGWFERTWRRRSAAKQLSGLGRDQKRPNCRDGEGWSCHPVGQVANRLGCYRRAESI